MASGGVLLVLWFLIGVTLASVALLFSLLRSGFEMRRANLFLNFRFYEGYFKAVSVVLLVLISLELFYLVLAPGLLDPFPDSIILLLLHSGVTLIYLQGFHLIRPRGAS